MNLAWITGTLSETEMEEEHPLELEAIRRRRDEKRRLEEARRAAQDDRPGGDSG
jgi:hypothetical protein